MEKIKLGTAYIDEFPLLPGLRSHKSDRISIGDTISSFGIQWVRLSNGLLVADRCICNNVSWEQLNESGLVFGKVIQIDGSWYLCRCLKVGAKGGDPNEWDVALAEAGEDDEVWCWKGQYFWGQETLEGRAPYRAVRGYHSARCWSCNGAAFRGATVGFRPALEALVPAPLDYGPLVGTEITLMTPDHKFVTGMLLSISDYDLGLETHSLLPDISKWAIPDGERIIIDQASVSWLKKS